MSVKNAVLGIGLVVGGGYLVRQHVLSPPAPSSPARPQCKPAPVSSMDPHPELAPWRCLPEGEGPDIELREPRRVYGNGDALPRRPGPPRRPPRPSADLQELEDWKAEAYLDYLDAERERDGLGADRARAEYVRASARLEEARRSAR